MGAAHRKSVRKAMQLSTAGLRLNCGCGPNLKRGWVNIDASNSAADLHLDLRRPLPFGDGSATAIYSEHFFEHLEYPAETGMFLAESLRVLERGGSFRVGIPDAELPIISYASGDDLYFKRARELWHPRWCNTRMHNINYHFRQGTEHKYAYDYETLEKVLIEAGFSSVTRVDFDPAFDSESRKLGTLYAEARK
jgi:predicted SAM-dependent methyltransferase